jgi:prevent-host-death family protein
LTDVHFRSLNWRVYRVLRNGKNETLVVSALRAPANFGKLLRRVEDERRSLVIEKRGTPKAVLLSIRDYVRLRRLHRHADSHAVC